MIELVWPATSRTDYVSSVSSTRILIRSDYYAGTSPALGWLEDRFNRALEGTREQIRVFTKAAKSIQELRALWTLEALRLWRKLLRRGSPRTYVEPDLETRVARVSALSSAWRVRR